MDAKIFTYDPPSKIVYIYDKREKKNTGKKNFEVGGLKDFYCLVKINNIKNEKE